MAESPTAKEALGLIDSIVSSLLLDSTSSPCASSTVAETAVQHTPRVEASSSQALFNSFETQKEQSAPRGRRDVDEHQKHHKRVPGVAESVSPKLHEMHATARTGSVSPRELLELKREVRRLSSVVAAYAACSNEEQSTHWIRHVKSLHAQFEQSTGQLQAINAQELDNLRRQLQESKGETSALQDRLRSKDAAIARMAAEVASLQRALDSANEALDSRDLEVRRVQQRAAEDEAFHRRKEGEIMESVEDLREQLQNSHSRLVNSRTQHAELLQHLAAQQRELRRWQIKCKEQEHTISEQRSQLRGVETFVKSSLAPFVCDASTVAEKASPTKLGAAPGSKS